MSRRGKLKKFSNNEESWNVIEHGKELFYSVKGNWRLFFGNDNPLVIELACGRGEYTVGLAERFPDQNFVGIDIKGDRIWRGSQYALAHGLKNVAFLRANTFYLTDFFGTDEVDEIWLTFPDPRPKYRDEKHRLANEHYLKKYQQVLKKEGWFKFKTDHTLLFAYTLQVLSGLPISDHHVTFDLYQSALLEDHHGIKTKYEKIWTDKGEKIKYMKFKF